MPELIYEDVVKSFEKVSERLNNRDADVAYLKLAVEDIVKRLKFLGRAARGGAMDGSDYSGFWPNEEAAKSFGDLVLEAIGKKDKAMDTTVGSEGGVLVPESLSSFIIQQMGTYGKYRKHATKVKLSSGQQNVPKVTSDLTIYSPGEGAAITQSDMVFGMVGMLARKLACLSVINSELEEDAVVGMAEVVGISITRSMAKKEDLIGFMGDGTETYFGMTGIVRALRAVDETIGNIKSLQVASGNAYSEITLADLHGVVGILPDDYDEDAVWYMNKKFYFNVIYPLAEAAGNAGIFEILSDKKTRYLLGYPVEFVSCMPSTEANSQICAVLGDLAMGAYLGERRQLEIERSKEAFFAYDQIGVRGVERISISVFGVGDTTDAGPIVGLITAAS
ncbi:MAG: phage major capsid protein [Sedimentisphaerales bacterium]|nr:phage major capsid protein [Sedimentisphaerales bacterium]